mmetsp:Transcript_29043/g.67935  ORF Transcript_29043/g.67935 Transcript_29043/m.67935 type:complete len:147 (+) Transcript_29043:197-637(+)|eukprot:CAMPEP_0114154240 /NCGR_PEP_ID=MMETSP0043_2-20121206/24795_1 /TAXON_ID=464988 /ORGANISM="Hemiselmis andersenii, Strain CCMP644" /LENGTH=146 /DNA_ID=CAMNT_0001249353 /DNA_START=124 /DNA_END=564 /DNA_ORIENTATION=+
MSDTHGKPTEGMECMCTLEDIDEESYCEYQTMPSGKWHPSMFASSVVEEMLNSQFQKYLDDVEKAASDCAAAVRRLVVKGPPTHIFDAHGLPLPEGETHIEKVWFMKGDEERPALLKGALQGAERETLWDSQKQTLAAMEAAEAAP